MKRIIYIALLLLMAVGVWPKSQAKKAVTTKKAVKTEKVEKAAVKSPAEVANEQALHYYFYEAMRLFDHSQYGEAFALLQHCEAIAPNDPGVCHYLAVMYGGLNNQDASMQYAKKAYEAAPADYWNHYVMLCLQSKGGEQVREGVRALEHVVKTQPDNTDAAELLQRVYLAQDDYQGALRMQDRIDKAEGETPYGTAERYQILCQMNRIKQANQTLDAYLKRNPDDDYFQVYKGDALLRQNDREGSFEQYMQVLKTNPDNPYLALSLANWYGTGNQTDSAAYYEMQAISNEAVSLDYKQGILKDYPWLKPDSLQLIALRSLAGQYPQEESALQPLSRFYLEHQMPDTAITILRTLVDINPKNATAWSDMLSAVQADSTASDSAVEDIARKALSAMPESKQWYYIMSIVMVRKDDTDSALVYCQKGLSIPDSKDDEIRYRLALNIQAGDLYSHKEMPDSAYVYYDAALQIDPENVYVLNNYAYFLAINGGDLRKAEKMSQVTIKKEPTNATFLDTYAWILHLEGQDILAKFYMQKAWDNVTDRSDEDLRKHYETLIGPIKE